MLSVGAGSLWLALGCLIATGTVLGFTAGYTIRILQAWRAELRADRRRAAERATIEATRSTRYPPWLYPEHRART